MFSSAVRNCANDSRTRAFADHCGLFAAFGRFGLLGSTLRAFGIELPFTQAAVVLAVAFVASPLYVRQAIAAFEAVDHTLVEASRTLGASPAWTLQNV